MITTSTGSDVGELLAKVAAHPERYAEVLLCCPFLDAQMVARFIRLADLAQQRSCGLRLITSAATARQLASHLPGHPSHWRPMIESKRRLHAKVYLALARRGFASEGIVTSANLTRAAACANIELGVRATSTSASGRDLLDQVHYFIRRLSV